MQVSQHTDKFKIEFPQIDKEIQDAQYILALSENWDDDSALKISDDIYKNAALFLKNYTLHIFDRYNVKIASPSINPVKDGTIDIEWQTPNARFLINFRNNQTAAYYGDNRSNLNSIKGRVGVVDVEEYLATWMIKLKE